MDVAFENRRRLLVMGFITAVAVCSAAPAAFGQGAADTRITSGLFSGGNKPIAARQHLDFLVDSSETFDTHLPVQFLPTLTPDSLQNGGYSTLVKGSSNYEAHWRSTDVRASASGAFRYYGTLEEARVVSSAAVVGFTSRFSRNLRLQLDQNIAYSPSYLYQVLPTAAPDDPGSLPTTAPDYNVGESGSVSYGTTAVLSHDAVAGGRVHVSGGASRSDFSEATVARPDVLVYSFDSSYARRTSRTTELSAGYSHHRGEFGYGGWTTEHGFPLGFSYRGPLWITRKAELHLNVVPEWIDTPQAPVLAASVGREFRLSADASLHYPFLRTWLARARVSRRLEYIASLPRPVFSNGYTLAVEGYASRRTQVTLSATYSENQSLQDIQAFSFDTYAGDAYVRYAFTRNVGVYAGYLYYHYDALRGAELLEGIPGRFGRTGLRVGLMVFVPVIGR